MRPISPAVAWRIPGYLASRFSFPKTMSVDLEFCSSENLSYISLEKNHRILPSTGDGPFPCFLTQNPCLTSRRYSTTHTVKSSQTHQSPPSTWKATVSHPKLKKSPFPLLSRDEGPFLYFIWKKGVLTFCPLRWSVSP